MPNRNVYRVVIVEPAPERTAGDFETYVEALQTADFLRGQGAVVKVQRLQNGAVIAQSVPR
jgi:hypothetical protein